MFKARSVVQDDVQFVKNCIDELENSSFSIDDFMNVYSDLINCGWYYGFILSVDEVDCGYMGISFVPLLHHCGKVMEIQELIVLPQFRNKKTGKNALEFALNFAKESNAVILELATNKNRGDAHRFYKKFGFNESHFKFTYPLNK